MASYAFPIEALGRLLRFGTRFQAQVRPGDVTITGTIDALHEDGGEHQDGVSVASGSATARLGA